MNRGFLKLIRGEETVELFKYPNAFTLLAVIAYRARRRKLFDDERLGVGEALLGDWANYGMSEQEYRTAKTKLRLWGFATFKTTSRETVARLVDNSVFDINAEENEGQPTDTATDAATGSATDGATPWQQASNTLATTNKKEKKESRQESKYCPNSEALRLSQLLLDLILERKPDFRKPNLSAWSKTLDRMLRCDHRTPERIEAVIRWTQGDSFWQNNVLCADKLREKFDQLELNMGGKKNGQTGSNIRDFSQQTSRIGAVVQV